MYQTGCSQQALAMITPMSVQPVVYQTGCSQQAPLRVNDGETSRPVESSVEGVEVLHIDPSPEAQAAARA